MIKLKKFRFGRSRSSCRGPSPSSSSDSKSKTLGLYTIHQPGPVAPLDIIFVHGLGGDSRKTWSKNHDPSLYWPGLWLPLEPDIGKARILSFGYNANLRPGAPRNISTIADFAKELLYEMRFGKDENGEDLDIGKVPIIFVVHSMGGLVVKKAYLLGQNDAQYQDVVRSISAIVFLATPHRGSDLARALNRVFTATFQSPKDFVNDLAKSSPALEELNEEFRHIAPKLAIVSFYETLATSVGPKKLMVLEKDSSILGYPNEVSTPLDADHHDVCKYSGPDDPNYVSVRNTLKSLVGRFRSKGVGVVSGRMSEEARDVEKLLAVSSGPEDDFNSFRRQWMPGTCNWLLDEPDIKSWLEETPESRVVWFSAPPASGKSIASTHVISHLRDSGIPCQYFFFKFGDQPQRSLSALLRSIAYQVARDVPPFRRILIQLPTEGLRLEKVDPMLIWQRIFESILFHMELSRPLYWIIDALDESESPKVLLDLLRSLPRSRTPVRVLIASRKTESLFLGFGRLSGCMPIVFIEKDGHNHNSNDIRMLVERETKHMRGSNELRQQVIQSIMGRAVGNFLWVRLVLEEILNCHTEEAIQETLDEIPGDMSELYQRMELTILNNPRKANRLLAKALLQWTICARRSLTVKELSQALRPDFPEFLDLRRTIQDVCGQFILIDPTGQVGMLHQTARDYLIRTSNSEVSIDPKRAHGQLFMKTVLTLLDPRLRLKLAEGQHALRGTDPFVFYAATSWTYHLRHADAPSDEALTMLVKLFSGPSVLTWIHSLALAGQLEILVKAAKVLTSFVSTYRKLSAAKNPLLHRLSNLELLDQWIVDLVKVVGKFSGYLLSEPSAIYKLVPPFCPKKSVLYSQFHHPESAEVSVSCDSNTAWNDNLARISLPNGHSALQIACAGRHIAVLDSAGTVSLWNSHNFAEIGTLRHREPVTVISFNKKGSEMVTCGLRSTKLWSIPSGRLLSFTSNPADSKAMAVVFADNDAKILVGSDDKVIRYLRTHDFDAGWHVLNAALLRENSQMEGTVLNSPICMAFNGDATQIGVSYRGFPLSVWALNESRCIGRCRRAKEFRSDHARPSTSWFGVDRFTWNPISGHIIGLYKDGCIFKWHPITDENQEVQSRADEVAASSDGKLFVTSDSEGTVRVWSFADFSVIYQLSSADLVTGLTFSPDCRRFYDLRDCSVNAWESNSLIRFSETEGSFSDAASEQLSSVSVSQASEAWLGHYEAITALAVAPDDSLYCVGNEEGVVNLVEARTGEAIELARFLNFLNVSHLAWDEDAKHIVAADLGGDIIVKRLVLPAHGGFEGNIEAISLPSPRIDLQGRGIHQMLFSYDSSLVLIVSEDRGQIWAVDDGTVRASTTLEHGTARRWLKHPTRKQLFLGFGINDVKVFQWQDFAERPCIRFREGRPRLDSQMSIYVNTDYALDLAQMSLNSNSGPELTPLVSKAMLTQDGRHLLVQIKDGSAQGRITKRTLIFDSSAFEVGDGENSIEPLTYSYIPPDIVARVEHPLGILSGSRLAFLDQDLWVCTYRLGSVYTEGGHAGLKRHYFIPRDWVSTESLEQCCMMTDGTVLCPRDDRVAVIRSSLDSFLRE